MKTRNGFVSNSSSSSFVIIAKDNFSTVKDVAKYVISVCNVNNSYLEQETKELEKIKNPDTPVFFNTYGDETYIRKVEDKIVLTTSQNIDLHDIYKVSLNDDDLSENFYKVFAHDNEDYTPYDENGEEEYDKDYNDKIYIPDSIESLDYSHKQFKDYFILKHGFYGSHTYLDGDDACKNCNKGFSRGWNLKNGNKICDCQLDKYKILLARKEKLKNINESS